MNLVYVTRVNSDEIKFSDRTILYSNHESDCCENHYLCFDNLKLEDFDGLIFDISDFGFIEKVEDYGIRLIPTNGHPISIPGYGYNNGWYSANLEIILRKDFECRFLDITECQEIFD